MRSRITTMMFLMTLAGGAWPAAAQVSCDPFNECITNAVCQTDGSCQGAPKSNGSPCDPSAVSGDCATGGQCFTFGANSLCMPTGFKPVGTPCTPTGLGELGACLVSAQCEIGGLCLPQIKECTQPSDKCMVAFCDPSDGQCHTVQNTCQGACSTGACDPSTGECINMQPANEGQVCGTGDVCAGTLQCHSGDCVESSGGTPTPSPTPTHTVASTATPTVTPPTGTIPCVGDCGGNHMVVVTGIITLVNIVLGNSLPSACANGIPTGAQVNITLIIQAVNNALTACPPTP